MAWNDECAESYVEFILGDFGWKLCVWLADGHFSAIKCWL